MPELPDVEIFREYLARTALHKKITGIQVNRDDILTVPKDQMNKRLRGQTMVDTHRHGKHLLAQLDDGGWLSFHFGMTGFLKYYKNQDEAPNHVRLRFDFDNEYHLAFDNQRLLGEVGLTEDVDTFVEETELGPDALAMDYDTFRQQVEDRRGMVKTTLMNQSILAGIGNVYSDEILFQARLHPRARINDLSEDDLRDLFDHMKSVLQTVIDHRVEIDQLPDSFMLPHREEGADCPGGGTIEKINISGRNGYYCPKQQVRYEPQ